MSTMAEHGCFAGCVHLAFYPLCSAASTDATDNYATFTFTVPSDGTASSTPANTMMINVVVPGPIAATGAPTVAATTAGETAYNEDVSLTATTDGISDPNGIDETTLMWQWEFAAAPADGSAPAEGAYADVTGATAATLTPLQVHVGLVHPRLRVLHGYECSHGRHYA